MFRDELGLRFQTNGVVFLDLTDQCCSDEVGGVRLPLCANHRLMTSYYRFDQAGGCPVDDIGRAGFIQCCIDNGQGDGCSSVD